jgi:hypothetical protein
MTSGPKQRVVVFLVLAALAAGGLFVWWMRAQDSQQSTGTSSEQAALGDRLVARKDATDTLWELSFPGARPTVEPVRIAPGAILEEVTKLHPEAVAGGQFPHRLEIRASGALGMEDVMFLMRDVARAAASDLEIVLQVNERVRSLEMTYVRWDGKSPLPILHVTALKNETSGEYVLVSGGDREARILRSLVAERAIKAIAAQLPAAMLEEDRAVRFSAGSGSAPSFSDGATLLAALRQRGRRLRIAGVVEGQGSPRRD